MGIVTVIGVAVPIGPVLVFRVFILAVLTLAVVFIIAVIPFTKLAVILAVILDMVPRAHSVFVVTIPNNLATTRPRPAISPHFNHPSLDHAHLPIPSINLHRILRLAIWMGFYAGSGNPPLVLTEEFHFMSMPSTEGVPEDSSPKPYVSGVVFRLSRTLRCDDMVANVAAANYTDAAL
ncbi:hypothetical protein BCR34DRAFT_577881 [Clohesyomyces aquaticus]|uniref:Uncharacterized protein n=1 Tax=Clohesyomyces aquaticus TaxID=1231657 RepID=A0A1Y1YHK3_9PLEO|nr:hypothetical protein BCR34DRAFT_577881 [Clohesyomyces aquaticus]